MLAISVMRWSFCFECNWSVVSPFGVASVALERGLNDLSNWKVSEIYHKYISFDIILKLDKIFCPV